MLIVEIATTVARIFDDPVRGIAFAQAMRLLPDQVFIPLDDSLASEAGRIGAEYRLRGADSVYAAAKQNGSALITHDNQQLERLSGRIKILRTGDALNR